jgi:hypothetical protein
MFEVRSTAGASACAWCKTISATMGVSAARMGGRKSAAHPNAISQRQTGLVRKARNARHSQRRISLSAQTEKSRTFVPQGKQDALPSSG